MLFTLLLAITGVAAHGYVPQIKIGNEYIPGWDITKDPYTKPQVESFADIWAVRYSFIDIASSRRPWDEAGMCLQCGCSFVLNKTSRTLASFQTLHRPT